MTILNHISYCPRTTGVMTEICVNDRITYNKYDTGIVYGMIELQTRADKAIGGWRDRKFLLVEKKDGFNPKTITGYGLMKDLTETSGYLPYNLKVPTISNYLSNLSKLNPNYDPYKYYGFVYIENVTEVTKYEEILLDEFDEDVAYQVALIRDEIYGQVR